MRKNRKSYSGFSLLEVIISVVLLSITMAGLANLFVSTRRYMQHSRYRMSGGEMSRYFLDPLHMQVRENDWASTCVGAGSNCPGSTNIGSTTFSASYSVTNISSSDLRKVRANITWNETAP